MNRLIKNTKIELVGIGHPDRWTDYLAQTLNTEYMWNDEWAKVALELTVTSKHIFIGGEVTSTYEPNFKEVVKRLAIEIYGEDYWKKWNPEIINGLVEQSSELSDIQSKGIVAGDQGVIYGFWSEYRFSQIKGLYKLIDSLQEKYGFSNDWKLIDDTHRQAYHFGHLSISVSGLNTKQLEDMRESINKTRYAGMIINPKGEWLTYGPMADTGQTNRKLLATGFGAGVPHGGGGDNGKDVSKVDFTGILHASEIAKSISDITFEDVIVELSYKIGDEKASAKAYTNNKMWDISDMIGLTVDRFIKVNDLRRVNWGHYSKMGGTTFAYITRDTNE